MSAVGTEQVFCLPDLGEGLAEAEIVQWRVAVGDLVEVDQIVVEVETAKAVVDVPCPYAGRVVALHGEPGQSRPVGQPLISVEAPAGAEPAAHATYREEERAGSGNVLIGYGTGHGAGTRRRRRPRLTVVGEPAQTPATPAPATATAAPAATATAVARSAPAASASAAGRAPASAGPSAVVTAVPDAAGPVAGPPLVISPIVRRLAREHGLDLAALRGSGPGGMVRRADVENAVAATPVPAPPAVAADAEDLVIPLTGIRRAIAEKLSRSRREIPEVTIWVDVDATALLETRAAINAARPEQPVSVLALLARICVRGLGRFPQLNAHVDTAGGRIVQSAGVHLGIATQTDRGLLVPVIRDAQRLDAGVLAERLRDTTTAARAGTLTPDRLTGGTFTLNNYGVFGVDGSTPIINHPEAALLGIGRIVAKPWVVGDELAVRRVTQLSLTFDHRVCDGGVAGGFLRYIADRVEQPALLIAEL